MGFVVVVVTMRRRVLAESIPHPRTESGSPDMANGNPWDFSLSRSVLLPTQELEEACESKARGFQSVFHGTPGFLR